MKGKKKLQGEGTLSDQIRRFMGPDVHNTLIRELGGRKLFIPAGCGAHHPLAEVIGLDQARKLCGEFAGQTYDVPLTQRVRERIITDLKADTPVTVIAQRYYCSRRTVFRVKAEMAQLPNLKRQGSLF